MLKSINFFSPGKLKIYGEESSAEDYSNPKLKSSMIRKLFVYCDYYSMICQEEYLMKNYIGLRMALFLGEYKRVPWYIRI